MERTIGNTCIEVTQGDITKQQVDAIVNAANTSLLGGDHRYDDPETPIHRQARTTPGLEIGDDVWIGTNSVVLPGVTIGRGAVIGAATVVTEDVPAFAVVVGNPGRVVKYRGDHRRRRPAAGMS